MIVARNVVTLPTYYYKRHKSVVEAFCEFQVGQSRYPRHESMIRYHIPRHGAGLYDLRRGPKRRHANSRARKAMWRRERAQGRRRKRRRFR